MKDKEPKIEYPGMTMEDAAKMINERAERAKKMYMPIPEDWEGKKEEGQIGWGLAARKAKVIKPVIEKKIGKEEEQKIIAMSCQKHYKMYLLSEAGYDKKEIAGLLAKGNVGYVSNELKKYSEDPNRAKKYAI